MADVVMNEEKEDKKAAKRAAKAEKKLRKKSSKKGAIFIILTVLIILSAILAAIYLDLFGIRSNLLNDTLEKIPVINNIMPPTGESNTSKTKEELELEVSNLTSTLLSNANKIEELESKLLESQNEIIRLKAFEDEKLDFMADKEAFDIMVASENPDAYISFYEEIYPETAEEVYRNLKVSQLSEQELKNYIARFENMKAGNASNILSEMIYTDLDIVIMILENLSNTHSASILEAFDPIDAATVVKRMSPRE